TRHPVLPSSTWTRAACGIGRACRRHSSRACWRRGSSTANQPPTRRNAAECRAYSPGCSAAGVRTQTKRHLPPSKPRPPPVSPPPPPNAPRHKPAAPAPAPKRRGKNFPCAPSPPPNPAKSMEQPAAVAKPAPAYQLASAASEPAFTPAAYEIASGAVQSGETLQAAVLIARASITNTAVSSNEIITERGYWQGLPSVEATDTPPLNAQ